MILGLNGVLNQILGLLGPECEKHYRLKNYCGMSNGDNFAKYLGYSIHFMSDAACPFHTSLEFVDKHVEYENWVGNDAWEAGLTFKSILNDPYYYPLQSVWQGADNLGNDGYSALNQIGPIMRTNNNWRLSPVIQGLTSTQLIQAQRHNRGLAYYCASP